jgi:cob(I)alamin adenosyltransferase
MKIYTASGDRGKTSLFSGERVSKASRRVEAYGDVDELNSVIGVLISSIENEDMQMVSHLRRIQSNLFDVGSWLAVDPGSESASMLKKITPELTEVLEKFIDDINVKLPPLRGFILPGGCKSSGWSHIARTVCRRAERHVILAAEESVYANEDKNIKNIIVYLNRLSDYFFVLARYLNQISGVKELVWKK